MTGTIEKNVMVMIVSVPREMRGKVYEPYWSRYLGHVGTVLGRGREFIRPGSVIAEDFPDSWIVEGAQYVQIEPVGLSGQIGWQTENLLPLDGNPDDVVEDERGQPLSTVNCRCVVNEGTTW